MPSPLVIPQIIIYSLSHATKAAGDFGKTEEAVQQVTEKMAETYVSQPPVQSEGKQRKVYVSKNMFVFDLDQILQNEAHIG